MKNIIPLLVLLILKTHQLSKHASCLNVYGKSVGWYVIYAMNHKIRDQQNIGYLYYDNKKYTEQFEAYPLPADHHYQKQMSGVNFDFYRNTSQPSALVNTINQIQNSKLKFIVWNDQVDKGEDYDEKFNVDTGYAHSKFIMALDKNGRGFAISHSIPHFPKIFNGTVSPFIGNSQKVKGQDIFCFNVDKNMAEEIYRKSCFIDPNIYYNTLFTEKCSQIVKKESTSDKFLSSSFSKFSYEMKVIYKNAIKKQELDIFINGIPEILQSSIITGNYGESQTHSTCAGPQQVENSLISFLDNSIWYRNKQDDHAKWAFTKDKKVHYACFGDLNRDSKSQLRRGGSFFCIKDKDLKCAMKSLILKKETCNCKEDNHWDGVCRFENPKKRFKNYKRKFVDIDLKYFKY